MTSTTTRIDWNEWRDRYDTLTFAKQQSFYDRVYEEYPEQARFDVDALMALLQLVPGEPTIVELGGWNGGFAAEILRRDRRIRSWTNHEISELAVRDSACADPRYYGIVLHDWYWAHRHDADVLVASHVVEHLRLVDVVRAILATDCRFMYLQAPLEDRPTSWHNYRGSHILEVGWDGLTAAIEETGMVEIDALRAPHVRCFEAAP